jgi:hypothetical protein
LEFVSSNMTVARAFACCCNQLNAVLRHPEPTTTLLQPSQ